MRVAAVHFIPMAFKYTMLYMGGEMVIRLNNFVQNAILDKIMMEAFIYLFIF